MSEKTKYLGIDFGLKRIGLAISDETKKYSFRRDHILNDAMTFQKIIQLLKTENVSKIIIGYPLKFNQEQTHITEDVINFSQQILAEILKNNLTCDVELFDERLTSNLAEYNLNKSGLKKKDKKDKGLVDSISAQILLQDYLDKNK